MGISKGRVRLLLTICALFLFSGAGWAAFQRAPRRVLICEIQSSDELSPYLDQQVVTRGLVSWVDSGKAETALIDDRCPPAGKGSRGIILTWENAAAQLDLGDQVRVRARVRELEGETRLEAQPEGVEILSLGNPLPAPVALSEVVQAPGQFMYEDWEGQRIRVPRGSLVSSPQSASGLVLIPELRPDADQELVCFQRDVFSIQFLPGDISVNRDPWVAGSTLEEVTGLLRQDRSGYSLWLISAPLMPSRTALAADGQSQLTDYSRSWTPPADGTATLIAEITLTPSPFLLPSPTVIPSPTYYHLPLLITELLPNPTGQEPAGEWVEIFNPGARSFPLDGVKLGDASSPDGKEGMLRFPGGYRIGPGEVLVIANQSRAFEASYGFHSDFELEDSDSRVPDLLPYPEWGRSRIMLSNTGDEILLVSPWDQVLDLVSYGSSSGRSGMIPVSAPAEGNSLERYPPEQDRDQPGDWREREDPSPGRLDRSPPTLEVTRTVELTFTPTPDFTPAFSSSPTTSPTSSSTGTPSPTIATPVGSSTFPPTTSPTHTASGTVVSISSPSPSCTSVTATLMASSSPTETVTSLTDGTDTPAPTLTLWMTPSPTFQTGTPTHSLTPQYSPTISLTATPTPGPQSTDTITVEPATSTTSPSSQPSGTPNPTPSLSPSPENSSTPGATPVLTATATWEPTAAILLTPTFDGLVINEIYADPDPIQGDSNQDGVVDSNDDEFLELVNTSGMDLNLEGWEVHDGVRLRFTFPPGTVLGDGCGVVLFGGGSPGDGFGGSLVFAAGSLGLNNTGDEVIIRNRTGVAVASCSYGPEGGENHSLTRNPDLVGDLPLVKHGLIPEANGALFSAGRKIDGTALGDCP